MRARNLVYAVAATLLTAGCATMGPDYDPAVIERLTPAMSKADVIALLGKPTTTARLGDGTEQLMWVHSRGTMLGAAQARSVMLRFDASGKYAGLVSQAETNLR